MRIPFADANCLKLPGELGRDQDERYNLMLRNMIVAGTARPGQIVSHRLPIGQAPDAFAQFDKRADGYIKVVLDPRR